VTVPYLSFNYQNAVLKESLSIAFNRVLDSGWYILGKEVDAFELAYAQFSNVKYAVGVANGLDALIIALKVVGVQNGDEVIVPSNTYIATWLAVSAIGAIPVPVEPNFDTYNIDVQSIEAKITTATKAIIPVHLYGQACDMTALMELAGQHQLSVVEDNAQAHMATWQGEITGSFGHANATSFYPGKNLGAYGDAGCITTNDLLLYQTCKLTRNYGSSIKYYNQVKGMNSRLDEMQAAFLQEKLKHLQSFTEQRQQQATVYHDQLAGTGDLILPYTHSSASHVYHIYLVRTAKRDQLQNHLAERGVSTLIHYPVPPHLQEAYTDLGYKQGDFPVAEEIAETCISLPLFPGLSQQEQGYVIDCIKAFYH
jgi:dTDP-4-amino-4,6-dideoxygalactose transaminase